MPDGWPDGVTIRIAGDADLEAVEAIVAAAYAPYVARIGRQPGPMLDDYAAQIRAGHVHVLEQDGTLLGLVVLIREPDTMLLDNVAVSPAAQGRGHGGRLLAFAERAARKAGSRMIRLYTNQAMTGNIALYLRLGYVETHRATADGLHRVYMVKTL